MVVDWREAQLPPGDRIDFDDDEAVAVESPDLAHERNVSADLQKMRTGETQKLLPFMSSASPKLPR